MTIRRLLRLQHGLALPLALGIIIVLSISGGTLVYYSTSNARNANGSQSNESAFSLSEAGLANAMAVLNKGSNNALDPDLLPSSETSASSATYEQGTAKWWGVLDRSAAVWTVTGLGTYNNPTGPGARSVRRTLTAKVPVVPITIQGEENPAWNYIYARRTGNACDMTVNNDILGSSRLYVVGNLCVHNGATIANGPLIVRGNLDITHKDAKVGSPTNMSTRVETYVGGNCRLLSNAWAVPCTGNQDSRRIYSKQNPAGYVVGVNNNAPFVAEPLANFANWYENSIPGPSQSCTSTSGTPPTFDTNYPARDNNVALFELTPASSYSCRVGPGASSTLTSAINSTQTTLSVASAAGFPTSAFRIRIDSEYLNVTAGFGTTTWTVTRGVNSGVNSSTPASHIASQTVAWDTPSSGEISWNAAAKKLTVSGTVFIDGSVRATNGQVNSYDGFGALYVSGTFVVDAGTKICASVSGSTCNFSGWDPNKEMLTVAANGADASSNGITINGSSAYQGALYATSNIYLNNDVEVDGPVVGNTVIINNAVTADSFPTITTVPAGMPGDDDVYAQPNPPELFAG